MLGLKVKYEAVQKCKSVFNTFKDLIRVFYITEKSYLLFIYLDLCKKLFLDNKTKTLQLVF